MTTPTQLNELIKVRLHTCSFPEGLVGSLFVVCRCMPSDVRGLRADDFGSGQQIQCNSGDLVRRSTASGTTGSESARNINRFFFRVPDFRY